MRSRADVERVAELIDHGLSDSEIAQATGIPRRTIVDWRREARRPDTRFDYCPSPDEIPGARYAYLLGMYLGDGCISAVRQVWWLRITLDAAYPNIVQECCAAVASVGPAGNRVAVYRRPSSRCVDVSMYWKHWPWLIPQHGPGVKHHRRIELAAWQREIISGNHEPFLRGLLHSDGCRYTAHERKNGRHRWSVRYAFANRSDDIKRLFCDSCDAIGVRWTVTPKQVSVYRKASVERLDTFVGPKS